MAAFSIEVKETLSRIIEVEAEDEQNAIAKVQNQYENEEIILDYSDLVDTEILTIE